MAALTTASAESWRSNAADDRLGAPRGTSLLPRDLSAAQVDAAPTLVSADALLIEDLTDLEDDAFAGPWHAIEI